jgi:hypothetical protein
VLDSEVPVAVAEKANLWDLEAFEREISKPRGETSNVTHEISQPSFEHEPLSPRDTTRSDSSVASWVRDRRITWQDEDVNEDEDPEAAFYRDLKRQEDERQRRLDARRNKNL